MNSQFSPGAHPEKEAGAPITGGVIYFKKVDRPTGIIGPDEVIKRGEIVSFEDYRRKAFDAIGAPIPEEKAA